MVLKHLRYTFIALSFLAACSGSKRNFHVIGDISGMPQQTVILEEANPDGVFTVIIDSEKSSADGHFELSGIAPEPGLYRLHFQQDKMILLSIDKGNIKVTGDWSAIGNYAVIGSTGSESLKRFLTNIREHMRDFNTMSVIMDTLHARGNDSILAIAQKDFEDRRIKFTQFVERYADTASFEPNAIFAARMLNPASENNYLSAFAQSLNRRFPGTKMTKDFIEFYNKTVVKHHQAAPAPPIEVGTQAPDISLTAVDGKTVALSSLRGKYVLLDFWASWCGPCRGENPNVVAAYDKFKEKNFTVYGVSLDNNKDAWQKAIQEDNLSWTQVSDLKGWASVAAALYSVHSIPSNFLIDPTGKIIARDLRGDQLETTLQNVLNPQNP
jgi:peroxiredoxin